jgi:ABC-type glycerol-3-phosphate transport system substrate-binding protein
MKMKMKNLLIALLLLIATSASAQIVQGHNPCKVTLTTTDVTTITLAQHVTVPTGNVTIWLIADAGNTGTIKIDGIDVDLSTAYVLGNDRLIPLTVYKNFKAQASVANQIFYFGL